MLRRTIFPFDLCPAASVGRVPVGILGQSQPKAGWDRKTQAEIIRQMAEQPSSWRGWDLLHAPDPDWTDPSRTERTVQPVPQPLFPQEPFFLVDDSRSLAPQEAAREAVRGMLHYIKANKVGEGYELLEIRVGEPRLIGREEIIQRALARCGTPELNRWTREQIQCGAGDFSSGTRAWQRACGWWSRPFQ